ncbi:MAG TPA: hypothetical protein VNG11_04500, partial [Chloroflexota bacterium]|nr:hypothetical protein [Chloroflexota bacterium]
GEGARVTQDVQELLANHGQHSAEHVSRRSEVGNDGHARLEKCAVCLHRDLHREDEVESVVHGLNRPRGKFGLIVDRLDRASKAAIGKSVRVTSTGSPSSIVARSRYGT